MSVQECRQRRRRKFRAKDKKFRIRVRYKYHTYRTIEVPDYGTLEEMHAKYPGMQVWCADLPPENVGRTDEERGYRIDDDEHKLRRYARHKAWIDPTYKVKGKAVILVYNAD